MHDRKVPRRQRGTSLLEVLVAVFILALAFLGSASMQMASLSGNSGAMARTMATVAAYSMIDAMRVDAESARRGVYNTALPLHPGACPDAGTTLAARQLHDWCDALGTTLGVSTSTSGAIECTSASECVVTVNFHDGRGQQDVVIRGAL